MPQAKNRELIAVSSQAHEHLKNVVAYLEKKGIPTSGTKIASEAILSIPIPQPQAVGKKPRARRVVSVPAAGA
jgi:hypothetical protein